MRARVSCTRAINAGGYRPRGAFYLRGVTTADGLSTPPSSPAAPATRDNIIKRPAWRTRNSGVVVILFYFLNIQPFFFFVFFVFLISSEATNVRLRCLNKNARVLFVRPSVSARTNFSTGNRAPVIECYRLVRMHFASSFREKKKTGENSRCNTGFFILDWFFSSWFG